MRLAICAFDMDERYALAKAAEEALHTRGILPEISLFPMPQELIEASAYGRDFFDLVVITDAWGTSAYKSLCRRTSVVLVGERRDGVSAFDIDARYFLETPVTMETMHKALTRCLGGAEERTI